jgi:hypothetical protein
MRRIYYAFALRILTDRAVFAFGAFILSVYTLSVFTHVASIIKNFTSIPVGRVPMYIGNTFLNTDALTLLTFGLVCVSMVVLARSAHNLFAQFTTQRFA